MGSLYKADIQVNRSGTSKDSLVNLGAHATTVLPNAAREGEHN